jgi:hypothetical protein
MTVTGKKCNLLGCTVCAKGKLAKTHWRAQTRSSINGGRKKLKKFQLIHMDIMGPMDVQSQMKEKYLLTSTDDRSNYVWTFPLKTKDEAEETIKAWILEMERQT